MKDPNIITVAAVIEGAKSCSAGLPNGRWAPARPLGFHGLGFRLKATWLVWTGRADALTWEGQ